MGAWKLFPSRDEDPQADVDHEQPMVDPDRVVVHLRPMTPPIEEDDGRGRFTRGGFVIVSLLSVVLAAAGFAVFLLAADQNPTETLANGVGRTALAGPAFPGDITTSNPQVQAGGTAANQPPATGASGATAAGGTSSDPTLPATQAPQAGAAGGGGGGALRPPVIVPTSEAVVTETPTPTSPPPTPTATPTPPPATPRPTQVPPTPTRTPTANPTAPVEIQPAPTLSATPATPTPDVPGGVDINPPTPTPLPTEPPPSPTLQTR